VAVEPGIVVIEEVELPVSLGSIEELDVGVGVEELEFSNNGRL
jgi:hypothetical protein